MQKEPIDLSSSLIACNNEPITYDDLDPGIREVVRRLRAAGFDTYDSGDGKSKPPGEGMDIPHVVMRCTKETLLEEADRLAALVSTWGLSEDLAYSASATYEPEIGGVAHTTLLLCCISDDALPS